MTRSKSTIVTLLAAAGVATVLAGGLLAGSGIAVAQIVDDPPGSVFQTQGIREEEGLRRVPSPYVRAARAAAAARQAHAYAYIPVPAAPHHKVVRHRR
jgi:hypothetical protein